MKKNEVYLYIYKRYNTRQDTRRTHEIATSMTDFVNKVQYIDRRQRLVVLLRRFSKMHKMNKSDSETT